MAATEVAVVRDPFPGVDLAAADRVVEVLRQGGMQVDVLNLGDFSSAGRFNASRYGTVILTHSHHWTGAATTNFMDFVKNGGDVVFLGGEGFLPDSFQGKAPVLPAFSKYEPYRLEGVVQIRREPGQTIATRGSSMDGRFSGISAIGFTRQSAKFVPLLGAYDRYGRQKGWASGLLVDFDEYKGSNWLLFGISGPEFYRSVLFAETLKSALAAMARPELTEEALREHEEHMAARIELKTPAPKGFVHVSPDGKHLLYPDGRRFFMIGANYHRPLHTGEWYDGRDFDEPAFDDDFRKAKAAGVNCIRLGPSNRFYERPELVKEVARRHGIYLLIILNWGTRQDFVENAERVARMYAGEPMVLGYDIQNEPAAEAVAGLKFDSEPSPVMRLKPYEKYAGLLDRAALDQAVAARPARGRAMPEEDRRNLAAFSLAWAKATDTIARRSGSTYPGMGRTFEVEETWKPLADAVNATFGLWIRKHIEAIRRHDQEHLITVGYNTVMQGLPANAQLDFTSQHVYDWPLSHAQVMSNLTAMDRMAALWPGKPLTLGEFGYSNGVPMPDGQRLDFHTSAVGEMLHYLYALAKGYDGCMKWVVTDWHWDPIGKAADRGRLIQIYEAYFGMYWYDGNPAGLGRPKPVVHGMRFLSEYVGRSGPGGRIDVFPSDNPIGTGYCFRARQALFIGDRGYRGEEAQFESRTPENVFIDWGRSGIRLMATGDLRLTLLPEKLSPEWAGASFRAVGSRTPLRQSGDRVVIELLEGETVTLEPVRRPEVGRD